MSVQATQIDVHDYHELVAQIKKLDPKWEAPGPTQAGYKIAREKFQAASAEPYIKPNAAQQAWIAVGHKQTEIASKLADFVRRGLVKYSDFEFPDDSLPVADRQRGLNVISARLNEIWEEHSWSDGHRAKVAWHHVKQLEARCDDLEGKLASAIARIHGLEQEAAHV